MIGAWYLSLGSVIFMAMIYTMFGWGVSTIFRRIGFFGNESLRKSEMIGTWCFVGAAIFTLLQAVMAMAGVSFGWSLLGLSTVILVSVSFHVKNRKFSISRSYLRSSMLALSRKKLCWFASIFLFILIAISFSRGFSRPTYTWDSIAFWTPKMIAVWRAPRLDQSTFNPFNHPEYPLFVPILGGNQFILNEFPDEFSAKGIMIVLIYSVFFIWFISIFSREASFRTRLVHLLLFFMTMLSFVVREHTGGEYLGTADIFVGMSIFLGAYHLLHGRPAHALLVWSFVPWMKSEGQVWALTTYALIFFHEARLRAWTFVLGSTLILPWQVWIRYSGKDSSQYFAFDQLYARPWLEYAIYSVHSFREEFRFLDRWGLLFWLGAISILHNFTLIWRSKPIRILAIALTAQLAMYLTIFTITPEEQASFITAAIARLTLHIAPTVALITAQLFTMEDNARSE